MSTKLNKKSLPERKMFVSVKFPCVLYIEGFSLDSVPGERFTISLLDSDNPFVFGVVIERVLG